VLRGAIYLWNDAINVTQNIHGGGESGVISNPQTTELIGHGGVSDIHFRARFHVTVNANGDVRIARRTSVFVNIENLGDFQYMEPLGYRGLGRTARVGIRTTF